MDDLDSKDFDTQDFGTEDLDDMIVYGEGSAITKPETKPIPFDDDDTGGMNVSHAPLTLGGATSTPSLSQPTPVGQTEQKLVSSARMTGLKTFFTKLHPGAIEFLDEQVSTWLKDNPGVTVKMTNVTTGEVRAKKTEPNIIVTIWY